MEPQKPQVLPQVLQLVNFEEVQLRDSLLNIKCKNSMFQASLKSLYMLQYTLSTNLLELYFQNLSVTATVPDMAKLLSQMSSHFFKLTINNDKIVCLNVKMLAFINLIKNNNIQDSIVCHFTCGIPVHLQLGTEAVNAFMLIAEKHELLML